MRSLFQITIFPCLLLILLYVTSSSAQVKFDLPEGKKEWKRISTDTDGTVHVHTPSVVLETNGQIRATFRFSLAKEEKAFEKPGAKYKTRFETIQFDTRDSTYRIVETKLLDSRGKVIYESGPDMTSLWKDLSSNTASRFYHVAIGLSPLSAWTVVAARYPHGEPKLQDDDPNSRPKVNSLVSTEVGKFQVGGMKCSSPTYEPTTLRADEFVKWTGFSLKDAGFTTDKVDAIKIKCDSMKLVSEVHVLLLASANRATLLSGGVLLDLEKLQY